MYALMISGEGCGGTAPTSGARPWAPAHDVTIFPLESGGQLVVCGGTGPSSANWCPVLPCCALYLSPTWSNASYHRRAIVYPVRRGHGPELAAALRAGFARGTAPALARKLRTSAVFASGDRVVRYWEASAEVAEEAANTARVVPSSPLGELLARSLDTPHDVTSPRGFAAFFLSAVRTGSPSEGPSVEIA